MGCRAQPVRYPISRTVQQMTRETRMGQPSYTEFRILPEQLLAAMTPDALDSENQTIIQSYTCQISVSGQTATESCAGASGEFQNTYALGPNGRIQSSRQWTTPEIGFLRIVQVK